MSAQPSDYPGFSKSGGLTLGVGRFLLSFSQSLLCKFHPLQEVCVDPLPNPLCPPQSSSHWVRWPLEAPPPPPLFSPGWSHWAVVGVPGNLLKCHKGIVINRKKINFLWLHTHLEAREWENTSQLFPLTHLLSSQTVTVSSQSSVGLLVPSEQSIWKLKKQYQS